MRFRAANDDDMVFVMSSWLDSYRTSYSAGLIAMSRWYSVMDRELRDLLSRPESRVLVAYNEGVDEGANIYGWIATEDGHAVPVVHYCYVKHPYRKMEIAKKLFSKADIDPSSPWIYTCRTGVCSRIDLRAGEWDPLLARFPVEGNEDGR